MFLVRVGVNSLFIIFKYDLGKPTVNKGNKKFKKKITILDLTKLIGKLSFAAQAVVSARLQHRFLKVQQNKELEKDYLTTQR